MSENETHVLPLKIYLLIFGALLVLTGVTVQVAYVDLGFMNTVVALGIACFKASLVVLYFMHLRYSGALPKLFWVAGLLWLAILLAFAMSDYLSRQWIQQPQGWAESRGISMERVIKL
jgi:cytochrome c oxidase subunit 4